MANVTTTIERHPGFDWRYITMLARAAMNNKKPITLYTFSRRYIDNYTCIDTDNAPITLSDFLVDGGLIYYRKDRFTSGIIATDEIKKIVMEV